MTAPKNRRPIVTRARGIAALALAVGVVACGGDDEGSVPTKKATDGGPTTTRSLSTAFRNNCVTCHGEDGEGTRAAPVLPGELSQTSFIATVRSGTNNGMPAFKTTQISDADLKSDYATLKALNN